MTNIKYKNVCTKLLHKKPDGTEVRVPKFAFNTLDEAIVAAKNLNERNNRTHKAVAYKCNSCFKYHVGKNNTPVNRVRNYTTIDDIKKLNIHR